MPTPLYGGGGGVKSVFWFCDFVAYVFRSAQVEGEFDWRLVGKKHLIACFIPPLS